MQRADTVIALARLIVEIGVPATTACVRCDFADLSLATRVAARWRGLLRDRDRCRGLVLLGRRWLEVYHPAPPRVIPDPRGIAPPVRQTSPGPALGAGYCPAAGAWSVAHARRAGPHDGRNGYNVYQAECERARVLALPTGRSASDIIIDDNGIGRLRTMPARARSNSMTLTKCETPVEFEIPPLDEKTRQSRITAREADEYQWDRELTKPLCFVSVSDPVFTTIRPSRRGKEFL